MFCRVRHHAFTLIELLVVIGIIALLLGILLPTLSRSLDSARGVADAANVRQILNAGLGYAAENNSSLPFGLLATDAAGRSTEMLGNVVQLKTWADALAAWSGEPDSARVPWQAPGVAASDTPAYAANPVAMPAPLIFALRNTNHADAEKRPARLIRLYPDNALFWSSAAYAPEPGPPGPGVTPANVPGTVGCSGVDDGLAYGLYTNRNTPQARYRDREQPDPVAFNPLLAAEASIRVFGPDAAEPPNDRDFSVPLSAVVEAAQWMPVRFRYGGRCNVGRADGGVTALAKGREGANGLFDTEFRRWMLKIKFPRL